MSSSSLFKKGKEIYAWFYIYGKKRIKIAEKYADQGNAKMQFYLANCYWSGNYVKRDVKKHTELLVKYAKNGNVQAHLQLAQYYENGDNKLIDKDRSTAAQIYSHNAENGDETSQIRVIDQYQFGYLRKQDKKEALRLCRKYATQGNERAQLRLIQYYELGTTGLEKNKKEAKRLFKFYAKQGNILVRRSLAIGYKFGRENEVGTRFDRACKYVPEVFKKKFKKAIYYLKQNAEQGDVHSQCELLEIYAKGSCDVEKDIEQFLYYANQCLDSLFDFFDHEIMRKIYKCFKSLISEFIYNGEFDSIDVLISSPLYSCFDLNKEIDPFLGDSFYRTDMLDFVCEMGSKYGARLLINAHQEYGKRKVLFGNGTPIFELFSNDRPELIKEKEEVAKFLLVAGIPKPQAFDMELSNHQNYKTCKLWFDNMIIISLKLMILRKYVYCTVGKKCNCVRIPSYYPKPLYQWPTYEQEMEKIKQTCE